MTQGEYLDRRKAAKPERVGRLVLWVWSGVKGTARDLAIVLGFIAAAFIFCGGR